MMCHKVGMISYVQLLGGTAPLKFGRAKMFQNSTRFRTTLNFDREHLWIDIDKWWHYQLRSLTC